MNLYFILIWRLKRLDDFKFVKIWEERYLKNMRGIITGLFIIYLFLTIGIGALFGELHFFTGLFMLGITGIVLGYYMVIHFIKFLAIQNARYFEIKMKQGSEVIDYSNVVN